LLVINIKLSFTNKVQLYTFIIVDEFILLAGMRVWVVCTHTRTRLPDRYMMLLIYVPAGTNIILYPSPYRVKPVRYSSFGYPLPSLVIIREKDITIYTGAESPLL
jgi:hypothetical protein